MKSFPSTLNKGGFSINENTGNSSLKDQIVNSFKKSMAGAISNATSIEKELDVEGIQYNATQDVRGSLGNYDIPFRNQTIPHNHIGTKLSTSKPNINNENEFRFGSTVFDTMNFYRGSIGQIFVPIGELDKEKGKTQSLVGGLKVTVSPSLFNPFYAVNSTTITDNVPLLDTFIENSESGGAFEFNESAKLTDCSIATLVKLSRGENDEDSSTNNATDTNDTNTNTSNVKKFDLNAEKNPKEKLFSSSLGLQKYKYADFMYCKDLGKIPNNHLITLRRFAFPVGDDITHNPLIDAKDEYNSFQPDIARMVTWFGTEDNSLENILNYNYVATWKEFNSEIQQLPSREEERKGALGKLGNLLSPNFAQGVNKGLYGAQFENALKKWSDGPTYANNEAANGTNYDKNKIYEPINTIRSTHKYEGNLVYNHEFTLKFCYTLRAYDNINPKSAFLDLIGNILTMTYRQGNFWGGSRSIIGLPPNNKFWSTVNSFVDKSADSGANFINALIGGGENGSFQLDSILGTIKDAASGVMNFLKGGIDTIKAQLTTENLKKLTNNGKNILAGLIKNKLGRPSIYAFNSLLTDDNVGLWHVTIGNPRNPIASMGNLIITKSEIRHVGPLGIDDFPTGLEVTISLKHAKPRDKVAIERMYTKGKRAIYYAYNDLKDTSSSTIKTANDIMANNSDNSKFADYIDLDSITSDHLKSIRDELV